MSEPIVTIHLPADFGLVAKLLLAIADVMPDYRVTNAPNGDIVIVNSSGAGP